MNITAINAGTFTRNSSAKKISPSFKASPAVSLAKPIKTAMSEKLEIIFSSAFQALDDFIASYPDLISPAAIRCKHLTEETGIYREERIKLEAQEALRSQMIKEASRLGSMAERCAYIGEYAKREKIVDSLEQTVLLINMFKERGIEAMPSCFSISHQRGPIHGRTRFNSIHSFVVIGIDKGADSTKPATWGNNAVIIDPVNKIVLPAKEGLEAIHQTLNIRSFEKTELI